MIRITKQTDYALVLLAALSHSWVGDDTAGDRFSARELASKTTLPEPVVGKILKILLKGGILDSKRGSSGGYTLAKDPDQISVCDVVEAVEGPIAIVQCTCEDGDCGYSPLCPIRENIKSLNIALRKSFESISVKSMMTPLPDRFQQQFVENITNSLRVV